MKCSINSVLDRDCIKSKNHPAHGTPTGDITTRKASQDDLDRAAVAADRRRKRVLGKPEVIGKEEK